MHTIIMDIETIPLPADQREFGRPTAETVKFGNTKDEAKRQAILDKAVAQWDEGDGCALKAEYGQIALIGLKFADGQVVVIGGTERDILTRFWIMMRGVSVQWTLVGHNLQAFDIPFILRRSMILGIGFRSDRDTLHRQAAAYNSELIFDTMRRWQCGDRQTYVKLETLCHAFGVDVVPQEVCGKDFHKWWVSEPEKCVEYLKNDLEMTHSLYDAMR